MRKLLLFLVAVAGFIMTASAETKTITFSGGSGVAATTIKDAPLTVEFAQNSASNPPAVYNDGLRLYYNKEGNGCGMTIKTTSDYSITKVVFKMVNSYSWPASACGSTGTLNGTTWTSNGVNEVTFKNTNTTNIQVRVASMTVTYESLGEDPSVTPTPDPYPASLYLLGNVNGTNWSTMSGVEAKGNNGIYQWKDVTINDAQDGYGYFSFATTLGSNWDIVNRNDRYGAPDYNYHITAGETGNVVLFKANVDSSNAYSWEINKGVYSFTVDLVNKKISVTGTADPRPDPDPDPEVPDPDEITIYFYNAVSWPSPHISYSGYDFANRIPMTKVSGTNYIWRATVPGDTYECSFDGGDDRYPNCTNYFLAEANSMYDTHGYVGEYTGEINLTPSPGEDFHYYYKGVTLKYTLLDPYAKTIAVGVNAPDHYNFPNYEGEESVEVPEKINYIGTTYTVISMERAAFSYWEKLKTITIPNSITTIGERAFANCKQLTNITLPSSLMSIGDQLFQECSALKSITIPNSVTSIGDRAFFYTGLTNVKIPDLVTTVGEQSFMGCKNLEQVYLGNSVNYIKMEAFAGCNALNAITCEAITPPVVAHKDCFSNYSAVLYVPSGSEETYKKADVWKDFKTVISSDFYSGHEDGIFIFNLNKKNHTAIVIGKKPSNIPELVLPSSTRYENVSYTVTEIGENAFYNCTDIRNITFVSSIKTIGANAFYGCTGLTSVVIPTSIQTIGSNAFGNCNNLIKSAYPNHITSVPFTKGIAISYPSSGAMIDNGCIYGSNKNVLYFIPLDIKGEFTIPNSVSTVGNDAFSGCTGLTKLTIPASVTSVGTDAFSGCQFEALAISCREIKDWFSNDSKLKTVTLGNSVVTIGAKAFAGCQNLTSVNFPSSVTSIGESAFSGCKGLTSISLPNSVTSVGNNSFLNCSGIRDITISGSSVSIASNAFSGCSVETLSISCKEIKDWFSNNSKLKTVILGNSVVTLADGAFSGCSSLSSCTLPNSVTSIGNNAFSGCTSLSSCTIPNSVTSIGEKAFSDCSLTSVTIPNSVTTMGNNAFQNCSRMERLTIGNSLKSIPRYAFAGCRNLKTVTIPSSIKEIGANAFSDCIALTTITSEAFTPPTIQSNTFTDYSATLYVPSGCRDYYRTAIYWKNFSKIESANNVYLGIIGFNGKLKEKPIELLNGLVVDNYTDWVNNLELDRNTLLYYTVDNAIDKLKSYSFGTQLSTAAIITFTDGLDQGSLAMNTSMLTDQQYLTYLENKIATTMIQEAALKAYTIGVEGVDVVDEVLFRNNLESLASSRENAHRIQNLNQIDEKFDAIYEDLAQKRSQMILTVTVPLMSDNTVCRFTLDGASSAEASKMYIQGTFNRATLQLNDVTYKGMSSAAGKSVRGAQNGLDISFTFADCRDMNGEELAISDKNDIRQWTYTSSGKWQPNVEMGNNDINLELRNSTAIMLLIDCSSSLGDKDFDKIKYTANTFIERLIGYEGGYYNGIDDIFPDEYLSGEEIDWSDAEYYNLQGIRVVNPSNGLYIRRKGNQSQKVLVP